MLSDKLPLYNVGDYWTVDKEIIFFHSTFNTCFFFSVNKDRIGYVDGDDNTTIINKAKAYLAENPIEAYYTMPNPVTTDITALQDWDNIPQTWRGTVTVSADGTVQPSDITVTHYADKEEQI